MIARALRGEAVIEDRRTTYATAAFIAARAISSGTHVRQSVALHESIRELRELLGEAAADAEAREKRLAETLEAAALDAEARERRAADRDKRLYKVNVAMAMLAGFTLLAADRDAGRRNRAMTPAPASEASSEKCNRIATIAITCLPSITSLLLVRSGHVSSCKSGRQAAETGQDGPRDNPEPSWPLSSQEVTLDCPEPRMRKVAKGI